MTMKSRPKAQQCGAVKFGFTGFPGKQTEEENPIAIPMGTWVRAGWIGWAKYFSQ
jgi:hypothetical protein